MAQITSLSSFGHDFQTKIFKCMTQDRTYGTSIMEMLKPSYFNQQKFRLLLSKIKKYYLDYQTIPNYSTLKIIAGGIQQKDQIPNVLDLITKMEQDYPTDQILFVKKESLRFCRNQQMRDAIIDSVELLNNGDMDNIWQRFNKVLKVTMDGDIGLDMNNNFDYVMVKQNRLTIPTGYEALDKQFDGGVGKGQLAVVMAPTGGGKSQFLVNIAKGGLMASKVVVYITLQLSQKLVAARMASLLAGVPINSLHNKKEDVVKAIKYFYDKTNSKFIVKQYPTKSIGIPAIRAYIHKLKSTGINPNLLIVDYADLLKPPRNSKQKRAELEQTYESLRQLSGTQNFPIWTATQTNRSAIEEQIIGAGMVSQAYAKMFVPDQVVSISRTTQDKIAGTGKLHIIKNRAGAQGTTFSMSVDTSRCLFVIDRKLSADECGQDTSDILKDFKVRRQKTANTKMQTELTQFLEKKRQAQKQKKK